jgi:mRNA interferase YafQ
MNVRYKSQFKKDYRLMIKRGRSIAALDEVIEELAAPNPLPESLRNHHLNGNWIGYMECHIEPDWLLIYSYEVLDDDEQLLLVRTGSHTDLFDN